MIADITHGKNARDLLTYFYGPGLANEHTDPHLVASWNRAAPDPGRSADPQGARDQLLAALGLGDGQAGDGTSVRQVWHCRIYTAPEDRLLTDADWAAIARRLARATGIAPEDDGGCRWVAIRHADDHIHLLATTVRGDSRLAGHHDHGLIAEEELTAIECEYGLRQVSRHEPTTAPRPTRAEDEGGRPRPNPWHQATAAIERIPTLLDRDEEVAAEVHLAAFGEALAALPALSPPDLGPQLQLAALAFERVARVRSRIRGDHPDARALRNAVRAMRREPVQGYGAALAMLLDSAVLVVIAAIRWHRIRRHDQQVISARKALQHLRAGYDLAAAKPLADLSLHLPATATPPRYAQLVHEAVPDHAQQILNDPAWGAMFAVLAEAEAGGHQPARLLRQAVHHRNLDDARSPAHVLTWRIHRLAQRPAPSARALAARDRRRPY
ncbi:mobilization protein [Streptomyces sirii]|uniref:mobilization protein n=1 Tax=Streptomyces sirii TaxID=3127701 RepID=UPI003D36CB90